MLFDMKTGATPKEFARPKVGTAGTSIGCLGALSSKPVCIFGTIWVIDGPVKYLGHYLLFTGKFLNQSTDGFYLF